MTFTHDAVVTVVRPGAGDQVPLPGFGATFKLTSRTTGGHVAIVEHPFAVGMITAAHRHSREDEHSIVLAGEIGFRSDDSEVVLELARKYGLTYGTPDWMDDVVARYGLTPPSH